MKRIICFQEVGEMVQPAEDSIVVISNGISISGEMIGVGGTKQTRKYISRLLSDLGFMDVTITSIDLKFSNKGYNFMSITLSSSDAVNCILGVHPPLLNGKRVYIKPALFQPRRNMNRPIGNAKDSNYNFSAPQNRNYFKLGQNERANGNNLNPNAKTFNPKFDMSEDFPEFPKSRSSKWR